MTSVRAYPGPRTLAKGLAAVLGDGVTVVARRANPHAGTFASEMVTCRFQGTEQRLFCKYGASRLSSKQGLRAGVAYEANVLRRVLQPLGLSPRFYGAYTHRRAGRTWLIHEYLDGWIHANRAPCQATAVGLAARWIGRFHGANAGRFQRGRGACLNRYDEAHYLRWARRTARLAGDLHGRYPWLKDACRRYEGLVGLLTAQPATVIHGDYYTDNVLFRDGEVCPIDWEWAAVGVGEIDLASLTDRWPEDVVRHAVAEYRRARWPRRSPADFERVLDVARLYLCFRYMGIGRDWLTDEKRRWRFDAAHALSERLGLI